MTMHTDTASAITRHPITQKLLYQGSVYDVCESLTDFAKGGQVALSAASFGRLGLDQRRLYNTKHALEMALARNKQSAQRRRNAGLKLQERMFKCVSPRAQPVELRGCIKQEERR